ncbi:sensor histidine kinase [Arachidicoccus ginsenosidimutans]|uniref:sensor histidine kinase n=1 Tax=Arachidicoccus sp. BS20 TaxID=1850526 RepID=UPI000B0C2BCD|nr:histidine kinase [Arachidicoccus sp. BS20]
MNLSNAIIWISSLFIGILSSIPKILRLHIELPELCIDISIASTFTVFVWYFNLYLLPSVSVLSSKNISFLRLLKSLVIGAFVMLLLVIVHQLLLTKYEFESMMLMYEFRGLIINLTVSLFLYLLYQNYLAKQMNIELEKVKSENLMAQFELLKQQINPHFLFNSLNTLKSMVETGDENSAKFIVMLSDFYRFALDKKKGDVILLKDELEILQAFEFLLKQRFEDAFRLEILIDEKYFGSCIPPFTLQLLLENCLKHNVVSLSNPLVIRVYSDEEKICVENNLQPKRSYEETSTNVGLENINQRYRLLSGKEIEILKNDKNFTVRLPVFYASADYRR